MTASAFLAEVLRCFTGWLLLAAAVGKLRAWHDFSRNLDQLLGVGAATGRRLAPLIVVAEAGIGLPVLLNGAAARGPMVAALCLMTLFTALIGYKFLREDLIRCSCFGEAARSVSALDLWRNVLAIAAIVYYLMAAGGAAAGEPAALAALAAVLGLLPALVAIGFHDAVMLVLHPRDGVL
jgi:hypothetical protein